MSGVTGGGVGGRAAPLPCSRRAATAACLAACFSSFNASYFALRAGGTACEKSHTLPNPHGFISHRAELHNGRPAAVEVWVCVGDDGARCEDG
jgi:hypothetical protein